MNIEIFQDVSYVVENTTTKEAYYSLAEELIELSKVMLKAARVGTPGNEHLNIDVVQADFDEEIADVYNAFKVAKYINNSDQNLDLNNAELHLLERDFADQKMARWANRIKRSKEKN